MFDPRYFINWHKLDGLAADALSEKGSLLIREFSAADLNDLSGYADFIYRKAGSEWNQMLIQGLQWPKPPELEKMARLKALIKSEWERREVAAQPPALETAPPARAKKTPETPITFEALFVGANEMQKALQAAENVGMILLHGDSIIWDFGKKSGAISVFWDVLKKGKPCIVNFYPAQEACFVIAERFGTTISPRTIRDSPKYKDDLARNLKAHLER